MGKVSVEVKERYNAKTYDRATVRFHKGDLERIKARAESLGKSFNGYINYLIEKDMNENPNHLNFDQRISFASRL